MQRYSSPSFRSNSDLLEFALIPPPVGGGICRVLCGTEIAVIIVFLYPYGGDESWVGEMMARPAKKGARAAVNSGNRGSRIVILPHFRRKLRWVANLEMSYSIWGFSDGFEN
ncbi:unnamed protein product [Linum trigynum]|uniref:Uncharacterized protein n=1 Tax=Linum trigynum TaxID=586398 RepID=A0AAV2E1X0_9ROSI